MGFHGEKRNSGIVMRDKRLADRWRRTQERKAAKPEADLMVAIKATPEGGQTSAPLTENEVRYENAALDDENRQLRATLTDIANSRTPGSGCLCRDKARAALATLSSTNGEPK